MIALELITKILLVGLCLPLGYLLATTIAASRFRKKNSRVCDPLHLGVLIPAHNEAAGIGPTIKAVRACDYPPDHLEILVIADNCTDRTAAEARKAGALVFERHDPDQRGKGQALDWFLMNHKQHYRHLDAITIIDADVVPDSAFLQEISASLSHPEVQVVQGYNGVSNACAGWRPALCDAAFNVFNHLRMAGAAYLSGTAVLKGLGMGFRTPLLMQYGWPAHSVVEDMEFTLLLLRDGINVHYNPDAVVRSEMVTTGGGAASQRSRWEGGRFFLIRRMAPSLIRLWISSFESRYLYALFELAIPPLSLLVLGMALATLSAAIWCPDWIVLAGAQWLILALYVASGQIQRRAPLTTWLYLGAAPFFVLWKIPLYVKMLLCRQSGHWVRTQREAESSPAQQVIQENRVQSLPQTINTGIEAGL